MCRSDESENREDFIWTCVLAFQNVYLPGRFHLVVRPVFNIFNIKKRFCSAASSGNTPYQGSDLWGHRRMPLLPPL